MRRLVFLFLVSFLAWGQEGPSSRAFEAPQRRADGKPLCLDAFGVEVRAPKVLAKIPHDPSCYTQGLCFDEQGRLYESCGGFQTSELRELDPRSGRVLRRQGLSRELWAEGCCAVGAELLLLTWQNRRFFFFDQDLRPGRELEYFGEGWGVCPYRGQLALSDGSARLKFFQDNPWQQRSEIQVTETGRPVDLINELETVESEIYANVWPSDYIAVIDPREGAVRAWLDGHQLLSPEEQSHCDVLNGIAYEPVGRRLYLTGKFWPWMFVVELPGVIKLRPTFSE
ncbi:glutaminyl-peptide cyclotransferase [bacterium]|nr:glutaminyl-peptide cyclotransferase [bacterium]